VTKKRKEPETKEKRKLYHKKKYSNSKEGVMNMELSKEKASMDFNFF